MLGRVARVGVETFYFTFLSTARARPPPSWIGNSKLAVKEGGGHAASVPTRAAAAADDAGVIWAKSLNVW